MHGSAGLAPGDVTHMHRDVSLLYTLMPMPQQPAQTWQLMVDLGVDIVNVDNVVAFRSFVVSNLYQRRWRRTLGSFGLDPGRQYYAAENRMSITFVCVLDSAEYGNLHGMSWL